MLNSLPKLIKAEKNLLQLIKAIFQSSKNIWTIGLEQLADGTYLS